jgi:hypothetical protein
MRTKWALAVSVWSCVLPIVAAGQQLQVFPLGGEFLVNSYTTGSQVYPDVAADAAGNFVVVWSGASGLDDRVFGQRYASTGEAVGTEFQVNTYTTSSNPYPAVAMDTDGDFVVVWQSYFPGGNAREVLVQRYASSGAKVGTEFQVNAYTTGFQFQPDVAMDAAGNFVIVWNSEFQDGDGDYGIFGRRYASSGSAVGTEFQINTYTTGRQASPALSAATDGRFVVAWEDGNQEGNDSGVFAQRYDSAGTASGTEFHVNTYTTDGQGYPWPGPAAAMDPNGDFVIVWNAYHVQDDPYGIFGQRYASAGAPAGIEFHVNSYTTGNQGGDGRGQGVAVDAVGNFLVVWGGQGSDLSPDGVSAQAYRRGGVPLGSEFQVNSYTTYDQVFPAVAAAANGNFVVVWHSSQDGSNDGVFGQRYVLAYQVISQAVAAGGVFGTDTGEGDGATAADAAEATVTSANAGNVTIVRKPTAPLAAFGFSSLGQQFDITAPPATVGDPLVLVFELDASLFVGGINPTTITVYRNGVAVPNCTGTPGDADPDPCITSRALQGDLDVQLTVLTSAASLWTFALPCTSGFAKALFLVKENVAGKEKLIAKLSGGPTVGQTDLGDPLSSGGTSYRLRIYDDAQALVAEIPVERPADGTCSGGSSQCWHALGGAPPSGKGYKYKDSDGAAHGVSQILLKSSASSSKVLFKAKGPAPPFPTGIASALMSASAVTIELHGDDAPVGCFAATLTNIMMQDAEAFKAK